MAEQIILIDGRDIFTNFISDLAQVMDHSYDIDEIFSMYGDWSRRGEHFVNEFAASMFSPDPESDQADDFIGMRNAMINLYCAVDQATRGLERHAVVHMAYSEQDEVFVVTTR